MKIIIDNRETALIKLLNAFADNYGFKFSIEIEKLDLGDIIFKNDNDEIVIIIERKTLVDLASSIRDGRYKEQSYRLNGYPLHNHNIIYLIEGNINQYSDKYTKIKKSAIYTSMFSLNYYKGFSVLRSNSINESVDLILNIADKYSRENKDGFYKNTSSTESNNNDKDYTDVVKKVKKDNITNENIGSILLSQIPGVSVKTANVIMENYNSLLELMKNLEKNHKCLDDLYYLTQTNIKKRISKTAIVNILKYLIYQKNDTIKIIT
tara:strand:+ start:2263 stop:3057 length:795 start_codon:yes stop_codon:yes gene_type:complete